MEKNTNTMTLEQYTKACLTVIEIVGDEDVAIEIVNNMVEIFNLEPSEDPIDLLEALFGCAASDLFEK